MIEELGKKKYYYFLMAFVVVIFAGFILLFTSRGNLVELSPLNNLNTSQTVGKGSKVNSFTALQTPTFNFPNIAYAKDTQNKIVVYDSNGQKVQAQMATKQEGSGTAVKIISAPQFTPGIYTIEIDQNGKKIDQSFTWGVLAINPDKANYRSGENAFLSLAVLDEKGKMVCDANVTLTIKDPNGNITALTSEGGTITINPECNMKSYVEKPDYETNYKTTTKGTYEMNLTAVTKNGTYSIKDFFEAGEAAPFDIQRESATRIFPYSAYPVKIKVTANQDFTGQIKEAMPSSFKISKLDNYTSFDTTENSGDFTYIIWNVSLKQGQTNNLGYKYNAPIISPQFYLIGAMAFYADPNKMLYRENRFWQIAADDIKSNVVDTSTSSTATASQWQRKTFYDSSNKLYWVFYNNGTAIEYSYSSNGSSWTLGGTVGTAATDDFSVWYVNGTNTVYFAYRKTTTALYVIKGTLGASSISWGSEFSGINCVDNANGVMISRSSNGKLWVGVQACLTPTLRRLTVNVSTNADDPSSWVGNTNLESVSFPGSTSFSAINLIPLTTSGDMEAIYARNVTGSSQVYVSRYTDFNTTWAAPASVDSTASTSISAVSMDSDIVHVAYIDSSAGLQYLQYSSGSWGTPITIDSNTTDLYPALTKDGTNLYVFYIRSQIIYSRKGVSPYDAGSWGAETALVSTNTNAYLTSSYDISNNFATIEWTEGTGSPFNVSFYGFDGRPSIQMSGLRLNGVRIN